MSAAGRDPRNAEQDGGAVSGGGFFFVANTPTSSLIVGSTFAGNVADVSGGPGGDGGGDLGRGHLRREQRRPDDLSNVTVAANVGRGGRHRVASVDGGGIYAVGPTSQSQLFNATIAANRLEPAPATALGRQRLSLGQSLDQELDRRRRRAARPEPRTASSASTPTSLGFNLDSLDQCGFARRRRPGQHGPAARPASGQRRPDADDGCRPATARPSTRATASASSTSAACAADRLPLDRQRRPAATAPTSARSSCSRRTPSSWAS